MLYIDLIHPGDRRSFRWLRDVAGSGCYLAALPEVKSDRAILSSIFRRRELLLDSDQNIPAR